MIVKCYWRNPENLSEIKVYEILFDYLPRIGEIVEIENIEYEVISIIHRLYLLTSNIYRVDEFIINLK